MLRNKVLLTVLLLSFICSSYAVQVKIKNGTLEGEEIQLVTGDGTYYSFKGIPYAQPPLGNLRFAPPSPASSWTDVRSAKEHRSICAQLIRPNGTEDCLYLNVYTPPNLTPTKPYPVMVYIHGGAFFYDSGNSNYYSPDFLIPNGVILVTFNFRLEVLGFLSLQNKIVPGNNGLKDQVAALRWVQENIKQFGGNPTEVTIFGDSAGGACVGYHMLSKMSKGLFRRGILMSGVPLSDWALTEYSRDRAFLLGESLGIQTTNDAELLKYLRSLPVENLVNVNAKAYITPWDTLNNDVKLVPFGPVVEEVRGDGGQFLFAKPAQYLKAPNLIASDVDAMMGYTSEEGLFFYTLYSQQYDLMNQLPEYFLTKRMAYSSTEGDGLRIGTAIRNHYLNGSLAGEVTNAGISKFYSWYIFKYDTLNFLELLPQQSKAKRYLYNFNAETERNFNKVTFGPKQALAGVAHEDDLPYIFHQPVGNLVLNKTAQSYQIIKWMSKMWTNFAIYGNPTPDNSLGVTWAPWTSKDKKYLQIDTTKLSINTNLENDEYTFWKSQYAAVDKSRCRISNATASSKKVI